MTSGYLERGERIKVPQMSAQGVADASGNATLSFPFPGWAYGREWEVTHLIAAVAGQIPSVNPAASGIGAVGALYLNDLFGRTVAGGWGTPDVGPIWAPLPVARAADFSVAGGLGNDTALGANRVRSNVDVADVSIYADLRCNASPGATDAIVITTRDNGGTAAAGTFYNFRLAYDAVPQLVSITIERGRAGSFATLATLSGLTRNASQSIRVQASGTSLQIRTWDTGTTEPSTWDVSATDASITAPGGVSFGTTGATYNFDVDNVIVQSPATAASGSASSGTIAQLPGWDLYIGDPTQLRNIVGSSEAATARWEPYFTTPKHLYRYDTFYVVCTGAVASSLVVANIDVEIIV